MKTLSKSSGALGTGVFFIESFRIPAVRDIRLKLLVESSRNLRGPFYLHRVGSDEPGVWLVELLLNSALQMPELRDSAFQRKLRTALESALEKIHQAEGADVVSGVGVPERVLNTARTVRNVTEKLTKDVRDRLPKFRDKFQGSQLVVKMLSTSSLWKKISPHLNMSNRRRILHDVEREVETLEQTQRLARVAHVLRRHRTRSLR